MQPTMKLRWVERMEVLWRDPETQRCDGRTIKVLQQWWASEILGTGKTKIDPDDGEWRDVPIETD